MKQVSSTGRKKNGFPSETIVVVGLAWFFMVFEGYDLLVYGNVVPSLLNDTQMSIDPTLAGKYGSYVVIGMLIGALIAGTIADYYGRKKVLLIGASICSVFMVICGITTSPEIFGLSRFVVGLGLGCVMPVLTVLTVEFAPPRWRSMTTIIMFTGYPVGGIIASLLAIILIPIMGWRIMFLIAIIPLIVGIPLAIKYLPESINYLYSKQKNEEAEKIAKRFKIPMDRLKEIEISSTYNRKNESIKKSSISILFSKQYRKQALLIFGATFCTLFMIFGIVTWLPTIMEQSGYSLGSSIAFSLVLNIGTLIGVLFIGFLSDKLGLKYMSIFSFFLAFISFTLLSIGFNSTFLTYLLIAIAGIGTIGTQFLVNTYVGTIFPVEIRATALGWALGVGRIGGIIGPIVGGILVSMSLGTVWHFILFAIAGILGILMIIPTKDPFIRTKIKENKSSAV